MSSSKGPKVQAPDDWRTFIIIPDDYAAYRNDIIFMLEPITSMWDGHLNHVTVVTSRAEMDPLATRPIHAFSHRAGPKGRDFEKNKIDNMLSMNVIGLA